MQPLTTARAFWAAHPYLCIYAAIAVLSISLRIGGSKWWAGVKSKYPVVAGLLELARGLGFDAPKILQGLLRIAYAMLPPPIGGGGNGTGDKPKLPVPFIGGALLLALTLAGCGASLEPVQVAHVGAVSIAETNRIVAVACGEVAVHVGETDGKARGEAILARCQSAHDRVHESLVVAGAAIDAWRDGKAGAPACAVLDVQIAMLASADNARGFGAKVPASVDDAIAFLGNVVVSQLGGCKR